MKKIIKKWLLTVLFYELLVLVYTSIKYHEYELLNYYEVYINHFIFAFLLPSFLYSVWGYSLYGSKHKKPNGSKHKTTKPSIEIKDVLDLIDKYHSSPKQKVYDLLHKGNKPIVNHVPQREALDTFALNPNIILLDWHLPEVLNGEIESSYRNFYDFYAKNDTKSFINKPITDDWAEKDGVYSKTIYDPFFNATITIRVFLKNDGVIEVEHVMYLALNES